MNIVDGFQKKRKRFIEIIITIFAWFVMLGFFFQIFFSVIIWVFNLSEFYTRLFKIEDVGYTVRVFIITVGIAVINLLIMYWWGEYNYRKFGSLNRRKFPKETTPNEIAETLDLPIETVIHMQNNKIIVLDKTIV
ncbi:MAG: poly-beta-1,6-N-acetyl-D-glucosamine biosynthesis protein PgaD [Eubacteriales bacterium]